MTRATQFELEIQMQDRGYARFLKQLEAARANESQSNTAHGRELIKSNMTNMVDRLEAFIQSQEKTRRKAQAVILLAPLNLEAVAYLALKAIVNSLGHAEAKVTATAFHIGQSVSNTITMNQLAKDKDKKGLVKHIETSANRTIGNDKAKDKSVTASLKFFEIGSHWSEEERLKVGITLVHMATEAGLVGQELVGVGKDSFYQLVPTASTLEMIEVLNLCPEFMPVFLPMVVEPTDWDEDGNGGYLTLLQPLIKTRFHGHDEALREADLGSVRQSINAIQTTAWSVHAGLLEVAQAAVSKKLAIYGLPFNYSDSQQKRMSLRASSGMILGLAEEFKDREAIWFPHNMDWRGRVYPMVDGLSPQGNKLAKALLSFADGKRLKDGAENFLAIHIANEYGNDKTTLAKRAAWVFENEETILSVASDPFGPNQDFWVEADNPWGFLRGCMEWACYCEDPDGFMSTLPVAFDGSCSGLQHFSAMFKDETGGTRVNLVAGLERQDIYEAVRQAVAANLETSEDPLAKDWLASSLLTRSLFKTPTMTYGYSSEVAGMTDQIKQHVTETGSDTFSKDQLFTACNFLAKVTFAEIEKTVVKAAEAKNWLQGCVRGRKEAARWTTPDGLPVVQKYLTRKAKRIDIVLDGKTSRPQFGVLTSSVDVRKMACSISPNVIHSIDATHIRMVAVAAASEQIHSIAMIHDSFGCHAADAGRFFNIIREQFATLYELDVAEMLNQELSEGEHELPTMGDLNIGDVLENDYAFA